MHIDFEVDNKELKLLRTKVTYLEDRMKVLEKSLSRVNNILGRFQMTENNDTAQGFKDIGELYQEDNGHELI
jgi:hypothetical protein